MRTRAKDHGQLDIEPPLAQSPQVSRALRWSIFLRRHRSGVLCSLCSRSERDRLVCGPHHHLLPVIRSASQDRGLVQPHWSPARRRARFLIPVLLVAGRALTELLAIAGAFQNFVEQEHGAIVASIERITGRVGLDAATIAGWTSAHASDLTAAVGERAVAAAAGVTAAVMSLIFIVFATFLLLRDGDRVVASVRDLLPFERARSEALLLRIGAVVHGSVHSVVVVAVVQGALCGGMFWLLGVPSPALWGLATVICSVLPFGAAAVWVPGAIYLAVMGEWQRAIVMAVWGAGVVSTIDNFLRPRLMAGRVGLDELPMFFAMLGGLSVFGVLGIVLGPVTFATAAALVQVLTETNATRTAESPAVLPRPHDR